MINTKQDMIEHARREAKYYLKSMMDCTDKDYLTYYHGHVVAYRSMLANLGFDLKIDIKLEKIE